MSQSYETILLERRGSVAIVTINRPEKRNALNIQTRAEGAAVLDGLRADDSVRVVVLTGAGGKAFIAGADIAEFAQRTAISQREGENASFGQPEINLGIIPGGGGSQRLTRLVGEGKAMEMILTGEIIDAQTALSIGLVNHVVPADQLESKTMEIANRIAEKSPIALRLAKESIRIAARSNLDEGLRREVDLFALCFSSEDKDEGVKAFLEKRKPEFKGK